MVGKDKGEYEPSRDNPRRWIEAPPLPGITGTARWALINAQTNPRVKKELAVPIFVQLLSTSAKDLNNLIEFLAGATDQYGTPDHVIDRLQSELSLSAEGRPIQISLLSRLDSVENRFWRVLSVGQPLARSFRRDGFPYRKPLKVKKGRLSKVPVVGIVDDSIGFLHHRFCRANGTTRFHRLWIMHNDTLAGDPGPHIVNPLSGVELDSSHINLRLATKQSEMALYRQVNSGIFGSAIRHGTAFHAGHGTHVLDLAAGAEPTEAMAKVPIIAVQLSLAGIGDTSGAELDPDLMRGVEWIIENALQMKGRVPLVINISLGSLAGPLDGTSPVEQFILSQMQYYDACSGQAPIRVVIAYGNAHKSRLVAEVTLAKGETTTLDWRILPDDATESSVELRTAAGQGARLGFTIVPPDGGSALSLAAWPSAPTVAQYVVPSGVACEVTNEVEFDPITAAPLRDKLLVTVAPTIRDNPRPVACSGNWALTLSNIGPSDVTVSLRVRRDDTPGGYRRNGRQSWLDHPSAWGWEPELRAYSLPAPNSPITRKNTEVSYAGLESGSVYFVGAARPNLSSPPTYHPYRPSRYTAEGGLPKPDAPTLSALGDEGSALTGIRAAGVLSGSTARLSGTSMAAPVVTRKLLEYAMTGAMQSNLGLPHDPAEVICILVPPPPPIPHPRLGMGTLPA